MNALFSYLPLRKWTALDMPVLIRKYQLCNVSNIACHSASLLATQQKSSAYSKRYSFVPLRSIPSWRLFISVTKSFMNNEKIVGEKQSPCLTPDLQSNHSVCLSFIRLYEVVWV